MALVAVIAVPILLGYALNLTETTETGYKESGNSVNVTPLLQTGTGYTTAKADVYQLNTEFNDYGNNTIMPIYEKSSTVKTSRAFNIDVINSLGWGGGTQILNEWGVEEYYIFCKYYAPDRTVSATLTNLSDGTETLTGSIIYLYYNKSSVYYEYYKTNGSIGYGISHSGILKNITFAVSGGGINIDWGIRYANYPNSYVDLASGFHFQTYAANGQTWKVMMPNNTYSALMSINLDSITSASYSVKIAGRFILEKTTTDGLVSWTVRQNSGDPVQLYYNPNIPNNTYQFYLEHGTQSEPSDNPLYPDPYRKYTNHAEFRYIGNWQNLIGEANYYQKYEFDFSIYANDMTGNNLKNITLNLTAPDKTPTVRMDIAEFRAYEFPVIENNTYDPSQFRSNPSTTISDIQKIGTGLTFGGNTYAVSDGKITISGHSIPVKELTFSSVPNELTGYDNKIGNTVVSTSLTPSTLKFEGQWSASVSTDSMEQFTYTKTEWVAGSFGWNGMDQNFLIVGLITCLGVFIALGIYARKKGSGGLIPLMIAVGCAAAVFFIML